MQYKTTRDDYSFDLSVVQIIKKKHTKELITLNNRHQINI